MIDPADIEVKKIAIKDANNGLETYQNVTFKIEHFMGKDWYLIITKDRHIFYNPDNIIFLDVLRMED